MTDLHHSCDAGACATFKATTKHAHCSLSCAPRHCSLAPAQYLSMQRRSGRRWQGEGKCLEVVQAQAAEVGQAGRARVSTASIGNTEGPGSVVGPKRRDALFVHEAGLKSVFWQLKVLGKQCQHRSPREPFGTREACCFRLRPA